MGNFLIRNLDAQTVKRLKESAKRHGRSLQAEIREILKEATPYTMEEIRAMCDKWLKRLKGRKFSDSAELIREDRDAR